MAGLNLASEVRGQFVAIARVRWQLFVNSLRTIRGRMEMVSRIFIGLAFAMGGIGGAVSLGGAAWFFVSQRKAEWLAILLWLVFMFWQLFPILSSAFTDNDNMESSNLLRFPLSYRSYFLIRLAYGTFDFATTLGSLWLLGITLGIGFADPRLLFWAALVMLTFAVVNIVLTRVIFAWIERWLAQRRTREIVSILFFLFIMSFQLVGPLMNYHYGGKNSRSQVTRLAQELSSTQRLLPPGVSGEAIARMSRGQISASLGFFALLGIYGIAILWLLHIRLHAQYRGENLSEVAGPTASRKANQRLQLGWDVLSLPGPVAAVFEKELRYLSRSGPMLFTMITPIFWLLIIRSSGRGGNFLMRTPDGAFPTGAAYSLLLLTNLVYNNFGADGGGIQLFFASPVRFRRIVLAKNLAHMAVFALETVLVWLSVCLLFRPPAIDLTVATLAGILFAAPVNLAAGNLLSIYAPKKVEYGTFGRQRASRATVLASFGIQFAIFGLSSLVLLLARHYANLWLATLIFLLLAALAFAGYAFVLNRIDRVAFTRAETLISELSRA